MRPRYAELDSATADGDKDTLVAQRMDGAASRRRECLVQPQVDTAGIVEPVARLGKVEGRWRWGASAPAMGKPRRRRLGTRATALGIPDRGAEEGEAPGRNAVSRRN